MGFWRSLRVWRAARTAASAVSISLWGRPRQHVGERIGGAGQLGAGVGEVGAVGFGNAGEVLRGHPDELLRRLGVRRGIVALEGGQRLLCLEEPLAGRRQFLLVLREGRLHDGCFSGGELGARSLLGPQLPAYGCQLSGRPGEFRFRGRPQLFSDLNEFFEPLGGHQQGGFGGVDVGLGRSGAEVGEVLFGLGEAAAGVGEGGVGGVLEVV